MRSDSLHTARCGYGYDVHRLVKGRRLILGGVEISHSSGLEGHSDADVLLHAIADALLGAGAWGDIGKHFPNTDPEYKNISSLLLLGKVGDMVSLHKYRVGNIDATLVLDEPRIVSYVDKMRSNISSALHIPPEQVSVKATTQEGLGFVGKGKGVVAHAVASIIPL